MVSRFNRKIVDNTVGKVRPYADRLLIEMIPTQSEFHIPTGFTIYVPPSTEHQRMIARGTIRELGAGIYSPKTGDYRPWPEEFKLGIDVIFGKFAGTELKINGIEHRLMRVADILAIEDPPQE